MASSLIHNIDINSPSKPHRIRTESRHYRITTITEPSSQTNTHTTSSKKQNTIQKTASQLTIEQKSKAHYGHFQEPKTEKRIPTQHELPPPRTPPPNPILPPPLLLPPRPPHISPPQRPPLPPRLPIPPRLPRPRLRTAPPCQESPRSTRPKRHNRVVPAVLRPRETTHPEKFSAGAIFGVAGTTVGGGGSSAQDGRGDGGEGPTLGV